jgi:cellulose synthase/poly-beta-1,6-N-acetylglucosamine synthase-like glycosyltransferase
VTATTIVMESLFWVSALLVVYVYAGYPALLAAWARVTSAPPRRTAVNAGRRWPAIAIIVAARNEAPRLAARIENLLSLPYPGPREVVVVSDGSTDEPRAALAGFGDRVRLIELPARGKPCALNAGVCASSGEILVFADARQRFDRRALVELVAPFDDPGVGGVTGELVLDCETGAAESSIGDGVGLYWRYEKWMRRHESRVHSTLGATGAIYALRRALWRRLPEETLLDDVLAPMRAVLAGARVVFEERARAFDRTSPDAAAEARRKTRTLAGNYQILRLEPRLLVPGVNPVWLQYLSHKIGRLVVPWALVGALISSVALAPDGWLYASALVLQLGFYAMAAIGRRHVAARPAAGASILRRHARVAYTFVMMNFAALSALAALRRGRAVWH